MSLQSFHFSGLAVIWECEHVSDKWVILVGFLVYLELQTFRSHTVFYYSFSSFSTFSSCKCLHSLLWQFDIWQKGGHCFPINISSDLGNSHFFFFFPAIYPRIFEELADFVLRTHSIWRGPSRLEVGKCPSFPKKGKSWQLQAWRSHFSTW